MSDQLEPLKAEDLSNARSAAVDSARAADPAAAGYGAVSEFVHAARRGARKLGPADRRRDRERQADRGLHPARRVGGRAAAGRPLHRRHRDAHPQDVQAARRQPAPDRPGARAADARRARVDAAVPARPRHRRGRRHRRRRSARNRRAGAEHQDELPAGGVAVAAAVRRSADARRQHRRARPAGRLHRFVSVDHQHGGEAGSPRDARHPRADGQPEPAS